MNTLIEIINFMVSNTKVRFYLTSLLVLTLSCTKAQDLRKPTNTTELREEVVIDTDASEIQISVEEPGEYVIKTDEAGEEPMEEEYMEEKEMEEGEHMEEKEMCEDDAMEEETMEEEHMEEGIDEIMYEIALDEETMEEGEHMEEKEMCEDDAMEEEMTEEGEKLEELISKNHADEAKAGGDLTKTKAPGAKQAAKYYGHEIMNESKVIEKYNTLLTEAKELKGKNEEYKEALKQFRTMLAETVVFNSNLTYTTKLMMEHSTTKDEKENILKRFDNEVSTLKESKKLYKTIESELKNRKPINESIENKIIKEVSTSKSAQLNESTAYVDKETSRIMDLMKRVNKR